MVAPAGTDKPSPVILKVLVLATVVVGPIPTLALPIAQLLAVLPLVALVLAVEVEVNWLTVTNVLLVKAVRAAHVFNAVQFVHTIVPYPRRFTYSGGAYVEIDPWVSSATTKGIQWNQNPLYKVAPFEETIVWHEANYQSLAVNTVTNPAPGWSFNPRDWMGKFEPRNILHKTCNPDGTIIYWRALFADASKPQNPYVGYAILHTRCGIDTDLLSCTGT